MSHIGGGEAEAAPLKVDESHANCAIILVSEEHVSLLWVTVYQTLASNSISSRAKWMRFRTHLRGNTLQSFTYCRNLHTLEHR